jgi:transposase
MPKRRKARYSAECRTEALALAERIGVAAAASDFGLHATQIYQWRAKTAHEKSVTDRGRQICRENARLKRQLAVKTEEVTILEKPRRTSRRSWTEVRRHTPASIGPQHRARVRDARRLEQWLLCMAAPSGQRFATLG